MNILQIEVLLAFAACIVSFGWALKGFFRSVEKAPPGLRLIQITGLIFTLVNGWALWNATTMLLAPALLALALYGGSFWLFWSCIRANRQKPLTLAFNSDQPEHLTAWGPYRWVRHPFYSSYLVCWFAGAIATQKGWLLLPFLAMVAIYFVAARREEEKFLGSSLAGEYQQYRARTGMFWPRLTRNKSPTVADEIL